MHRGHCSKRVDGYSCRDCDYEQWKKKQRRDGRRGPKEKEYDFKEGTTLRKLSIREEEIMSIGRSGKVNGRKHEPTGKETKTCRKKDKGKVFLGIEITR